MSLELRDLRAKITIETELALDAYAAAQGIEKSEAVRDLLHVWAMKQLHASTLLQRAMKREGLAGHSGEVST